MIRIGIVGCGRILNAHLQGYLALRQAGIDNFRITALAARNESDALMFRKRGEGPIPRPSVTPPGSGDPLNAPHTYISDFQDDVDVQVYSDYRTMLEKAPIDAVNDYTTLSMHHQVGMDSLDAGKHLLTQKPLAVSVKAARMLVDKAKKSGLSFGVLEVVRYDRATRALRWAIENRLIGTPQLALMGSLGGLWSPDLIVAKTPWRHRKVLAGGGGAIDIGVHFFHLLRQVMGEVSWVSAVANTFERERIERDAKGAVVQRMDAEVDDTCFATIGFKSKAIGQLLWSWALHGEPLEIPGVPAFYGSKGCIRGKKIIRDGAQPEVLAERFESSITPEDRQRFFPNGVTERFALTQLDWLRAIESGAPMEASGEQGLNDLACAFAILESSLAGRRVTRQEVLDGSLAAYQAEIDEYYKLA
jgi:1,5-anhydro-D-fructose reductase (1,5-anhydro-D-mannitol-forming)